MFREPFMSFGCLCPVSNEYLRRNRGESKGISVLRGFLASVAIAALVSFGVYQAIMSPIFEIGKVPYRHARTRYLSLRAREKLTASNWTLILVGPINVLLRLAMAHKFQVWPRYPNATASIIDSATVTAHWAPGFFSNADQACQVYANTSPANEKDSDIAKVDCETPPFELLDHEDEHEGVRAWERFFPSFEIRVDFTNLLGAADARSNHNRAFDFLQVYVGLTNDTQAIMEHTDPIALFPGANLLGVFRPAFREALQQATLATLGFEASTSSF